MKHMLKKSVASCLAFSLALVLVAVPLEGITAHAQEGTIDNSSLLPAYVPDSEVELDRMGWPEWTKDIIIAEVNVAKATDEGTLAAMDKVLDHYAEMGVNCLWITPVEDMGVDRYHVGYTSYGPHTIDPYITGQLAYGEEYDPSKVDYAAGFQEFKKFVDEAHRRNIRIIIDKVTWGLSENAPLVNEHPEFFTGDLSMWGGPEFNWNSQQLIDWYKEQLKMFVMVTGCDGIRFDLEPTVVGYQLFEELRDELHAEGRKPLFFSEHINERGYSFAFEQTGGVNVLGQEAPSAQFFPDVFFEYADIVETVKTGVNLGSESTQMIDVSGQYRYYSFVLSVHDGIEYHDAPLAAWSYEMLYSSFIPIFYIGEEWNSVKDATASCLYYTQVDWDLLDNPENKAYYEQVKKLIALRWKYKDIFNEFPNNHRETNMVEVKIKGSEKVGGYARYDDSRAILVIPNVNERNTQAIDMTVSVPLADMKLDCFENYTVTDLLTGKVLAQGTEEEIWSFTATVEHNTSGLYLVEAKGERTLPVEYLPGETIYEYVDVYVPVEGSTSERPDEPDESDDPNDSQSDEPTDNTGEGPQQGVQEAGTIVQKVTRTVRVSTIPIWLLALIVLGGAALVGGAAVFFVWLLKRRRIKKNH